VTGKDDRKARRRRETERRKREAAARRDTAKRTRTPTHQAKVIADLTAVPDTDQLDSVIGMVMQHGREVLMRHYGLVVAPTELADGTPPLLDRFPPHSFTLLETIRDVSDRGDRVHVAVYRAASQDVVDDYRWSLAAEHAARRAMTEETMIVVEDRKLILVPLSIAEQMAPDLDPAETSQVGDANDPSQRCLMYTVPEQELPMLRQSAQSSDQVVMTTVDAIMAAEQRVDPDEHLRELMEHSAHADPIVPVARQCPDCAASWEPGDEGKGPLLSHEDTCPLGRAIDAVTNADREWFAQHPEATSNVRPISQAEMTDLALMGERHTSRSTVEVIQVAPGMRSRQFTAPAAILRMPQEEA
jgi:hypothetical protein